MSEKIRELPPSVPPAAPFGNRPSDRLVLGAAIAWRLLPGPYAMAWTVGAIVARALEDVRFRSDFRAPSQDAVSAVTTLSSESCPDLAAHDTASDRS